MKVIFKDGTELPYYEAREQGEFYDNAQRRVLEIDFLESQATFEQIKAITTVSENLSVIETIGDEMAGITPKNLWEDYEIKISISEHPKVIADFEKGTSETIDVITLKLAKLTNIEKQLKALGITF